MATPLNSPLEVGVRALMLLAEAYPDQLDLNQLMLLDYGLIHSGDLGGPTSLHPPLPARSGELGVKRTVLEQGLQVMLRAGLVEMAATRSGIRFGASDEAYGFISLLQSKYAGQLRERAVWIVGRFKESSEATLRDEMRTIFGSWSEEFDEVNVGSS